MAAADAAAPIEKAVGAPVASEKETPAIDPEARFKGTVAFYSKLKGYGFITLDQKELAPNDTVFVHWRNLRSDDRFPFLYKDLEVEFNIQKWKEWGNTSLRAKDVTMPGGGIITLQDAMDAEKKQFVGAQNLRYTGTLKFYNPIRGFGYISIEPGYAVDPDVPTDLRVERSEVNSGTSAPGWMQDLKVEFGIWKTKRDAYKAYNMTLPGGVPVTIEALENRKPSGAQTYRGEVVLSNWRQGWGFVKPDPSHQLPAEVIQKLVEQTKVASDKATQTGRTCSGEQLLYFRKSDVAAGVLLKKGMQVMFQIYTDDKGAGACQIQTV